MPWQAEGKFLIDLPDTTWYKHDKGFPKEELGEQLKLI
jgi:uncharacterized protein (DUF3820 family)